MEKIKLDHIETALVRHCKGWYKTKTLAELFGEVSGTPSDYYGNIQITDIIFQTCNKTLGVKDVIDRLKPHLYNNFWWKEEITPEKILESLKFALACITMDKIEYQQDTMEKFKKYEES